MPFMPFTTNSMLASIILEFLESRGEDGADIYEVGKAIIAKNGWTTHSRVSFYLRGLTDKKLVRRVERPFKTSGEKYVYFFITKAL